LADTLVYLAIKGKSKDEIWSHFRLARAPEQEDGWGVAEPIIGVLFSNGWYIIQDFSGRLLANEKSIAALSQSAQVLSGAASETTMFSSASGWESGKRSWTVEHNLDRGAEHLQVSGSPPPVFKKIKARIVSERDDTPEEERHDFYFSMAVDLFEDLTGFSYCTISNLATPSDYEFLCKAKG
jgi:hypothetical protein